MAGAGIAKFDRIRSRVEYLKIQKQGKRFRAGNFLVNYLVREDGRVRFGIVASSKLRRAVDRNRVKRVLREFYRLNRARLQGLFALALVRENAGADLVFVAYPGSEKLKYQEAAGQLLAGFDKELKRITEHT